jgi:hypothetical protein
MPRRSCGKFSPLEQYGILPACGCQMIKNTGANNAAADYDDLCFTGDFVHK